MKFEIVFDCTITGKPDEGENGLIYSCGCSGVFSEQSRPGIGEVMFVISSNQLFEKYMTAKESYAAVQQKVLSVEHILVDEPKKLFSPRLRLGPLNLKLPEYDPKHHSRGEQINSAINYMETDVFKALRKRGVDGDYYVSRRP